MREEHGRLIDGDALENALNEKLRSQNWLTSTDHHLLDRVMDIIRTQKIWDGSPEQYREYYGNLLKQKDAEIERLKAERREHE